VEDRLIDVMNLSPEPVGETFDVVLRLGVLYHLVDPIGALQRVASLCDELLVLETEPSLNYLPFPAARCWPTDERATDPTNWWSINRHGLVRLLHACGVRDIRVVYHTPLWRRVVRAAVKGDTGFRSAPSGAPGLGPFRPGLRSERIVIHAAR
jgi:tRNA (mo5U34)-methyltransferase